MKIKAVLFASILIACCSMMLVNGKAPNKQTQTNVMFVVRQQIQQDNQVIQLTLQISAQDPSLADAIQKSQQNQKQIRQTFYQFCVKYGNDATRQQCQGYVQTGQNQIQAIYYRLRGVELFKNFQVKFQIKFIVSASQHIGSLIDQFEQIMRYHNIVIKGIQWIDKTPSDMEEHIIATGLNKAKASCDNLGMQLHRIKSVTIVEEEQVQEKKPPPPKEDQQQDEEEQQEEEQQPVIKKKDQTKKYKFLGVCKQPKPKEIQIKSAPKKQSNQKPQKQNQKPQKKQKSQNKQKVQKVQKQKPKKSSK